MGSLQLGERAPDCSYVLQMHGLAKPSEPADTIQAYSIHPINGIMYKHQLTNDYALFWRQIPC
jgi:hypothetical protein